MRRSRLEKCCELRPAQAPAVAPPAPARVTMTNPFHARLLATQQREKERLEAEAQAKAADEKAKQEDAKQKARPLSLKRESYIVLYSA